MDSLASKITEEERGDFESLFVETDFSPDRKKPEIRKALNIHCTIYMCTTLARMKGCSKLETHNCDIDYLLPWAGIDTGSCEHKVTVHTTLDSCTTKYNLGMHKQRNN